MKDKGNKIKEILKQHVRNNGKEYSIIALLFIIGIFLGVLFVNNMQEAPKTEVESYLQNFISKMKEIESLDRASLLKTSIGQNIILAVTIWFFGTTVIRNSSCFWNDYIPRILFGIYHIGLYFSYGNVERIAIYRN